MPAVLINTKRKTTWEGSMLDNENSFMNSKFTIKH